MKTETEIEQMESALKVIHSWADFWLEYNQHGNLIKLLRDIRNMAARGLGRDDLIKK